MPIAADNHPRQVNSPNVIVACIQENNSSFVQIQIFVELTYAVSQIGVLQLLELVCNQDEKCNGKAHVENAE